MKNREPLVAGAVADAVIIYVAAPEKLIRIKVPGQFFLQKKQKIFYVTYIFFSINVI